MYFGIIYVPHPGIFPALAAAAVDEPALSPNMNKLLQYIYEIHA